MANPIPIYDALKSVISLKRFVFSDGEAGTAPVLHGPDGTPILTVNNPAHIRSAGSTGTDYSANAAATPSSGLLQTVGANPARLFIEIQNQSADQIQVVRDRGDGTQATSILLAPGSAAGQQGGGWSSATFKGRVRVYGPTGAQVAIYED